MDTTTLDKSERASSVMPGLGAVTALTALSACGGGGTGNTGSSAAPPVQQTPPPAPAASKHTLEEASRFLAQAAIGATRPLIEDVASKGMESWLDRQLATGRAFRYYDWLEDSGYTEPEYMYNQNVWQRPLWKGLVTGGDQLRQRVTLALLDLFVVGHRFIDTAWRSMSMAHYLDVLADNAFGNLRTLLEEITYTPAMGSFLTYIGSRKADAKGRMPDENYAREFMQLFTIGLEWMNQDGSPMLDGAGRPIPTYKQDDVAQLARVFTGMEYASSDRTDYTRTGKRLVFNPDTNDAGPKSFLGVTVSGSGAAALGATLDTFMTHANLGPWIGRRLIQSLVTSNPSPAYVERVSRVFNNNGANNRGDLSAVIKAILLDPEARAAPAGNQGRLRTPVERLLQWARAFSVNDPKNEWQIPDIRSTLGHAPGWSPTVFNYFRPGYSPPLTQIRANGLLAPEFELASEQRVIAYVNFMKRAIGGEFAWCGMVADHAAYLAVAEEPRALVDELALVLAAGQLSESTRQGIASALSGVAGSGPGLLDNRIRLAALLVLSAPEYLVME